MKAWQKNIHEGFKDTVKVRGEHVHESRWKDWQIRDVSTLAMLSPRMRRRDIRELRKRKYELAKSHWQRVISRNNKRLNSACGPIFEDIEKQLIEHEPPSG
jgi:hypothetical protein